MIAVEYTHIKPVFIPDYQWHCRTDDQPIITIMFGSMRNPSLSARSPIPGSSTVAAERDPHLINPFPRPGPDARIFRSFLKHRPSIGISSVRVKPTQESKDLALGAKRKHPHRLIVVLDHVRVRWVGRQDNVRAPMHQVLGSEPRDLTRGQPVRDRILHDPNPLLMCV